MPASGLYSKLRGRRLSFKGIHCFSRSIVISPIAKELQKPSDKVPRSSAKSLRSEGQELSRAAADDGGREPRVRETVSWSSLRVR